MAIHIVEAGESLGAIAARFGVGVDTLVAANPQVPDPDLIEPGQSVVVPGPEPVGGATYLRHDIWTLDAVDPWHPVIYAYARGIGVMRGRAADDPTSLGYQAAVHGMSPDPLDGFRKQCQHNSWFFGSWHRMYLYWFERIVRAAIQDLPDVDPVVKQTWALPYWNYSNPDESDSSRRRLPQAFRDLTMPDGVTPNQLRDPTRAMNDGAAMPPQAVRLAGALAPRQFAGPGGFAGGKTGFNHFGEDPNAAAGPLEQTPHNVVHGQVGGNMGSFDTAGLDPVFWLHHANIDRLWDVWLGQGGRENTTETAWLTGVEFKFHDENGTPLAQHSKDVAGQPLDYAYEDVSAPGAALLESAGQQARRARPPEPPSQPEPAEPSSPPELVGATDTGFALTGETVTASFAVAAPSGPALRRAAPRRVFLDLADVTAPEVPELTYGVYVNVPDGDPATDDEHYVGNASFFGIETLGRPDSEHAGMRMIYDITDLYNTLTAAGRWSDQVSVTFVAQRLERPAASRRAAADEPVAEQNAGEVRIGRIGLFFQ